MVVAEDDVMSTHENPRRHDQVDEPDAITSERLLDGREQEHPLAGILAAASAPSTPRDLRREREAVHAFASREVLDARTAAGGLATERIFDRMRSRRDALAAALRPVPLAKGLIAATVAVAAVFAVGTTVTGPADPVGSTSPAALALDDTATTTTTVEPSPTATTTTGTTTTTAPGHHPRFRGPAVCAPWWAYAHHHKHKTWPTTWPTDWPTTWPTAKPTRTDDDETVSPTATVEPTPTETETTTPGTSPTTSPTAKPDRKSWNACYAWWRHHHHQKGFHFEDKDGQGQPPADRTESSEEGFKTDRGDSGSGSAPGTGSDSGRDDKGGSGEGSTS
jgi:hypothetical protein